MYHLYKQRLLIRLLIGHFILIDYTILNYFKQHFNININSNL